jgi:acyl-CoA thioesterase II
MEQRDLVRDFRELLAIEELEPNRFVGSAPGEGGHLFGGLLFGLAVRAAYRTVAADRALHMASVQFFGRALSGKPLEFEVTRLRDGGAFSTRRVSLVIDDVSVVECDQSFATPDTEVDRHPSAPDNDLADAVDVPAPLGGVGLDPAETRSTRVITKPGAELMHPMWARSRFPLDDDPSLHHGALAFLSDLCTLWLGRIPAESAFPGRYFKASTTLNHTLWIHRPFSAEHWMRFDGEPVSFFDARGLVVGAVHDHDGALIATFAQETMHRLEPL